MSKKIYQEICRSGAQDHLTSQDWWIDSLVHESSDWDAVVLMKNGCPYAAMPYVKRKVYGLEMISMPDLTQAFKVWVNEKNEANFSSKEEGDVLRELFSMLPSKMPVSLNLHYSHKNLLPLHWIGFSENRRYTYLIDDVSDIEMVLKNFQSNMRNKINKAKKIVTAKLDNSRPEDFYRINTMTFSRQGLRIPYSYETFLRHDYALAEKKQRQIFYAIDDSNSIHSALYLTWDSRSAFVHMVGEDPILRNSGAGIYLIFEAIKFTSKELGLKIFDFEGSMIESVEKVRRACGGIQHSYSNVKRQTRLYALASFARTFISG